MSRKNDNPSDSDDELSSDYDADSMDNTQRREPRFSSFDDDEDDYEEPDRDTDYPAGFRADGVEEEFEDEFHDDDALDLFPGADTKQPFKPDLSAVEDDDAWLEDDGDQADEDSAPKWPLSLILVAVVALVLLAAGGYGVMQQRAATEAELRDLRAALATTARPENVGANRDALQSLQQAYDKLSATAEALGLENRRLADTVAGLQAQLGVQQAVLTKTVPDSDKVIPAGTEQIPVAQPTTAAPVAPTPAATQPATPQPAAPKPTAAVSIAAPPQPATPQPATPKPAAKAPASPAATTVATGPWFVNFGSYASRNMAQSWASKLHPDAGKVIITPNTKDGRTLYRVRVVGLASRNSAQEVARQLETQQRVSALWVGKE